MRALETTTGDSGVPEFQKVAECLYRHASGTYYGLVKRHGKQFRRSLKTSDRQLAGRRLAEFRQKIGALTETRDAGRIGFDALAQRWLPAVQAHLKPASALRRAVSVRQLDRFFGARPVRDITPAACDEWMTKRSLQVAPSTFNNERETLQAILALGVRDGLLLENPARHLPRRKLERVKMVIPTLPQFKAMVEGMRAWDARAIHGVNLVELLAYSGMRLAEATALTWGDVDFDRGTFTVTGGESGTKNHEVRTVPLFPAMRGLLEKLRVGAGPDAVALGARVIPTYGARRAMATACKKANLPEFGHHDLRHFFVSNAIEKGVDFKTVAAWVGHKDGGVLVAKTYGHLRDTHSFEMAKRMTLGSDHD